MQDALVAVGEPNVQLAGLKLPAPGPLRENVTEPVGADFVPEATSVTVAVHVVPWLSTTDVGEHATDVVVPRKVTVSAKAGLVLGA